MGPLAVASKAGSCRMCPGGGVWSGPPCGPTRVRGPEDRGSTVSQWHQQSRWVGGHGRSSVPSLLYVGRDGQSRQDGESQPCPSHLESLKRGPCHCWQKSRWLAVYPKRLGYYWSVYKNWMGHGSAEQITKIAGH